MKTPPRWADKFLEWYCSPDLIEDLQGDLHERFNRRVIDSGIFIAKLLFIIDVFTFFRPYIFQRTSRNHKMTMNSNTSNAMMRSYLIIAWRNLLRNKIFSFINVIGLAIGM